MKLLVLVLILAAGLSAPIVAQSTDAQTPVAGDGGWNFDEDEEEIAPPEPARSP